MPTTVNAKGLHTIVGNPAPSFRADLNDLAADINTVGNRKIGTTAQRNTATTAGFVWEGLQWFDTDLGAQLVYVGGVWVDSRVTGPVSYSPVWSTTGTAPAIGTGGFVNGSYTLIGKLCIARVHWKLGTAGASGGTGAWRFTVPFTAGAGVISSVVSGMSHSSGVNRTPLVGEVQAGTNLIQNIWANSTAVENNSYAGGSELTMTVAYQIA